MKKLVVLLLMGLFLFGCVQGAKESEFFKHGAMYKDWEHFRFSAWGYKKPSEETYKKTQEQNWWGKSITWEPEK